MESLVAIHLLIKRYTAKWIQMGKWVDPTAQDALLFLYTELHELKNTSVKAEYRLEAFDALMMALICLDELNMPLVEMDTAPYQLIENKWIYFDTLYYEVVEAYLRGKTYVRNNRKTFPEQSLTILCYVLLREMGDYPVSVATKKLELMDKKRK